MSSSLWWKVHRQRPLWTSSGPPADVCGVQADDLAVQEALVAQMAQRYSYARSTSSRKSALPRATVDRDTPGSEHPRARGPVSETVLFSCGGTRTCGSRGDGRYPLVGMAIDSAGHHLVGFDQAAWMFPGRMSTLRERADARVVHAVAFSYIVRGPLSRVSIRCRSRSLRSNATRDLPVRWRPRGRRSTRARWSL